MNVNFRLVALCLAIYFNGKTKGFPYFCKK